MATKWEALDDLVFTDVGGGYLEIDQVDSNLRFWTSDRSTVIVTPDDAFQLHHALGRFLATGAWGPETSDSCHPAATRDIADKLDEIEDGLTGTAAAIGRMAERVATLEARNAALADRLGILERDRPPAEVFETRNKKAFGCM